MLNFATHYGSLMCGACREGYDKGGVTAAHCVAFKCFFMLAFAIY